MDVGLGVAQLVPHGLSLGLSHVPSLLLLVMSVQLVQGLLHLLHHWLVIILQADDVPHDADLVQVYTRQE